MSIDKLDRSLIEELVGDPRQTVQDLADKLSMKRTTVRFRLNRLREEGTLKIACVVNAELMGYEFLVFLGINVSPGKTVSAANQLASLPDVRIISLTAGNYNIRAWALFRDRSAFAHFISKELSVMTDITALEVMHSIQWFKNTWGYFKPNIQSSSPCRQVLPGDLDMEIIKALQQDPRQSITSLSRAVGCTKSAAKMRLDKLTGDGIINFVVIINPKGLGYDVNIMMLVKCNPVRIQAVAEELARQQRVTYVSLVTGRWQILVGAQFEDNSDLYNFLLETASSIPDITETEVIHVMKTVKYSTTFP